MESNYNYTGIVIYIVIPIIGLIIFFQLKKKMLASNIQTPPIREMFMMFFSYGGLLTMVLTAAFWQWSGMASLGVFYLIFIAPIIMSVIAYKQYFKRKTSIYHKWMFYLATTYFIVAPIVFYVLFKTAKN